MMGERLIVRVDKELCMSSGRCLADVPDAFVFDDDELAEVLPGAASVDVGRIQAAARNCPSQAITAKMERD